MRDRRMKQGLLILMAILVMAMAFTACNEQDFTTDAYRTLTVSKEFRDTALSSLGDLHRQGLISEEVKDEAIRIGDAYMRAHQLAVDAVVVYSSSKTAENRMTAEEALTTAAGLYGELAALVTPYLGKPK